MEITYDQKIINNVNYLEQQGYKVIKDNSSVIGKWVAFRQEGIEPILHGRVGINGLALREKIEQVLIVIKHHKMHQ